MSLAAIVQDFVDREFAREVDFLAELVKVPSDNPPGDCAPHAQKAGQLLQQLGLVVEAHPVPRAEVEAAGMRSVTNLIVRQRFDDGPVIALNAHGDVVPPGLGWRLDPYAAAIEDGPHGPVMYGRGVAVSKSDFATYAWTLLALRQAATKGVKLAGTLELHFTYDEEAGGMLGPKWLLDQRLTRPDAVIAAGFAYSVVTAHSGCLHLEVTVTGKQAHAAMPDTGVDALEAATVILSGALRAAGGALAPALEDTRHRLAHAQGRSDQWRHQHQCGAGSGDISHRPSHDPGRNALRRGSRAASADRGIRTQPHPKVRVDVRQLLLAVPLTPRPGTTESRRQSNATLSKFSASTSR